MAGRNLTFTPQEMLFRTWKLHFWLVEGINPGWMENKRCFFTCKKTVNQFDSLQISRGANAMRRFKRAGTRLHLGALPCAKSPYSTAAPGSITRHQFPATCPGPPTNFKMLIKCPSFPPKLIQNYLYGFPFSSKSYIRASSQEFPGS